MSSIDKSKINNSWILPVLFSILVIVVYVLIDGAGIILNSISMISGNSNDDLIGTGYSNLLQGEDAQFITHEMSEQLFGRLVILVLVLFPIIYISLRYHISLKSNSGSLIIKLIPFFRVAFGFIGFYYAISLGTIFSHEMFTNYYSFGHLRSFLRIIAAFVLLGSSLIDWPFLIKAIKVFPSEHPKSYKVLFILFISLCSCMLVEFQIGSKMSMASYMLFYNVIYWVIVQVFIDLLTRNVKIGAFVSLGFAYLIGLVNDVVYQFRGNYVMYGDLTVVRTALEVAGNYTYKFGFWFWTSLAVLILAVAVTVVIKFPKHAKVTVKEAAVRTGAAAALVVCVIFTFNNGMLYRNVFGVGWDYNKNVTFTGYIPYFLSNMNSIQKVELEGYDASLAEDALSEVSVSEEQTYIYPNIIIIQNEAFADLSVLYDIETNQDYMPFIRSLSENTRKGYLNMSVTGGPTANTEFEILMRSTLGFLPFGSVPYTQYVDTDLPSVAQVLRNQPVPYYTVAYHPYYTSGYRRAEVYNHFGFDEIIFEDNFREDFPEEEVIRDYLSDSADYRRVEEFYEDFRSRSDAPWFCFNVTIQNHGGYTQAFEPAADDLVYVTNFEATDSFNGYLSLIKMSDDAFRELIEYFENCDEPTIIAMYGDHQPTLDDDAMAVLETHMVDSENSQLNNYYVPYIIWANFDIEEEDNLNTRVMNTLSTNYFASTVFDLAGIELTDYDRYLLALHEQVPAITAIGVWDDEGNYYGSAEATPYAEELSALEMVQYNLIFDDGNRLTERFE